MAHQLSQFQNHILQEWLQLDKGGTDLPEVVEHTEITTIYKATAKLLNWYDVCYKISPKTAYS